MNKERYNKTVKLNREIRTLQIRIEKLESEEKLIISTDKKGFIGTWNLFSLDEEETKEVKELLITRYRKRIEELKKEFEAL